MPNPSITLVPGAAGLASFWDPIREHLPSNWQQSSADWPGFGSKSARSATRDPLSPLGVPRQLEADLPSARLITFDTDDHWVARRFPSETALAIRDFVEGTPRQR